MTRWLSCLLFLFFLGAITAPRLDAQKSTLTLSGSSVVFQQRTAADYDAGATTATSFLTFTVSAPAFELLTRTTTVKIRASSTTLGGTEPIGNLEWRRGDLSTWNAITSADVTIESRVLNPLPIVGQNSPWSNTVHFRIRLVWPDYGASVKSANYVITLSQNL